MARYLVTPATVDHLGAVMNLYEGLMAAQGRPADEAEVLRFADLVFGDLVASRARVMVAVVGRKVVGFLRGELFDSPIGPYRRIFHVLQFFVRPDYRRLGRLGHDLYADARRYAQEHGAVFVFEVPPARRVRWEARGFQTLGCVMSGGS